MPETRQSSLPRPPYDPEIAAALAISDSVESDLIDGSVQLWRSRYGSNRAAVDDAVASGRLLHQEVGIERGEEELLISILRPSTTLRLDRPCIYFVHGGGLMAGDRFSEADWLVDWVLRLGVVVTTVEYRLAPEHPFPAAIDDCYRGLAWVAERAAFLEIDASRILVAGVSAGGGLAAAVALMARDYGGPALAGQMLLCPMLDDRADTVSNRQFPTGPWSSTANEVAWRALLGPDHRGTDVSPYAAPSRSTNFAGLPSAYIDVGSAEVLRDEDVAYASALWAAGSQSDLHVWAGGSHGFDIFGHSALAQTAFECRYRWIERTLDVVRQTVEPADAGGPRA